MRALLAPSFFVDVAQERSLGHIAPPKISKKLTFVDLNS